MASCSFFGSLFAVPQAFCNSHQSCGSQSGTQLRWKFNQRHFEDFNLWAAFVEWMILSGLCWHVSDPNGFPNLQESSGQESFHTGKKLRAYQKLGCHTTSLQWPVREWLSLLSDPFTLVVGCWPLLTGMRRWTSMEWRWTGPLGLISTGKAEALSAGAIPFRPTQITQTQMQCSASRRMEGATCPTPFIAPPYQ